MMESSYVTKKKSLLLAWCKTGLGMIPLLGTKFNSISSFEASASSVLLAFSHFEHYLTFMNTSLNIHKSTSLTSTMSIIELLTANEQQFWCFSG